MLAQAENVRQRADPRLVLIGKSNLVNPPTIRHYYYGQVAVEEDHIQEDIPTIGNPTPPPLHSGRTRYGLGARGIDMIDRTYNGSDDLKYPIYDGHGNMLATISRSGSSYTSQDWKKYDVWGSVRSGATWCLEAKDDSPLYGYAAVLRSRYASDNLAVRLIFPDPPFGSDCLGEILQPKARCRWL